MAKFYQVGGSVRDELLGLKSKDIDYAVEADSFDSMRAAIQGRMGEIFLETPEFFTIRARVPELGACDFVLCRKDGAYSDGRRPETVKVGTIYDDLARRDFTVNAIAKAEDGTLIDPHEGVKDLENRQLRCVGSPEIRFTEDGLRMYRAVRFSITKNFGIAAPIKKLLANDNGFVWERLQGVSVERVREELHKCFACDTIRTLKALHSFPTLLKYGLSKGLWLKPTLEAR